jgi:type I restriction enzyme S subunit
MTLELDKNTWKRVMLGEVIRHITDRVDPETSGLERFLAGEHIPSNSLEIREWGVIGQDPIGPMFYKRFQPGHVLYVSRRSYLRKTAVPRFTGICGEKTFVLEALNQSVLLQEFLPFVLSAERFHQYAIAMSRGSVNPYINWRDIAAYEFDLPPVNEQKRISDLLWALEGHCKQLRLTADVTRAERIRLLDRLIGDALNQHSSPLSDIAEIRGGIQKGKSATGPTVERPYLRVANVQAGALDLTEVKTLVVSAGDADRYSLAVGDVLMTEGGDIDKLGRGTVWRGEIPNCLHQNHVFAIRILNGSEVSPYWVSLHAESTHGRSYFRVAAKRTSNLASVNKTQVSAFPIGLPGADAERSALEAVGHFDAALAAAENEMKALKNLRSSLLVDVFRSN